MTDVDDFSIYNFLREDTLLDWLEMYNGTHGFTKDYGDSDFDASYDFGVFLGDQRRKFKYLLARYMYTMLEEHNMVMDSKRGILVICKTQPKVKRMEATKKAIKAKIMVIVDGMLYDSDLRVWNSFDFLVRSDVFCQLFPQCAKTHQGYNSLDVAFSKLRFTMTGALSKAKTLRYYQAKAWLHLKALKQLFPTLQYGFIIGRECVSRYDHCNDALKSVACISSEDWIEKLVRSAISWYRRCSTDGKDWKVLPSPSVPELYPNMCNRNCGRWSRAKRDIAIHLQELTLIWNISYKNRLSFHDQKIFTYGDLCQSWDTLDKSHINEMSKKIITINTDTSHDILPKKIQSDMYNWRQAGREFFVDFETCNSLGDGGQNFPKIYDSTRIAMIGCAYIQPGTGRYICEVFVAKRLTFNEERRIIDEWFEMLSKVSEKYNFGKPYKVWCWSQAEKAFLETQMNSAACRHEKCDWLAQVQWCDANRLCMAIPLRIRGCFNYSLKSVAKALHRLGYIEETWPDSQIDNGLNAMTALFRADEVARQRCCMISHVPIMSEIIAYNRLDVFMMKEILRVLREHL